MSAAPIFDPAGEVHRTATVIEDDTNEKRTLEALRASEELHRCTLQALPAHIAVVDRQGGIIAVNQAWTSSLSPMQQMGNPTWRWALVISMSAGVPPAWDLPMPPKPWPA